MNEEAPYAAEAVATGEISSDRGLIRRRAACRPKKKFVDAVALLLRQASLCAMLHAYGMCSVLYAFILESSGWLLRMLALSIAHEL